MTSFSFGDAEEITKIIGLLLKGLLGIYDWRGWFFDFWVVFGKADWKLVYHFIGILVAELEFHEHIVEHPLSTCETIIDHVLRGIDEPIGLVFGDGRNVVPSRNAIFDEDVIAELSNHIVFLHSLLRLLDLQQSMLVVDLRLTGLAKVEVFAEDALVANTNDAVLVIAARADSLVVNQLGKTRSPDLQFRQFFHLRLGLFRQHLFFLLHFLLLGLAIFPDLHLTLDHLLYDVLNLFIELSFLDFHPSRVGDRDNE